MIEFKSNFSQSLRDQADAQTLTLSVCQHTAAYTLCSSGAINPATHRRIPPVYELAPSQHS